MFEQITGWHWLVLGIALFTLEALGMGGILVGAAAGAIVLAIILAVYPELSWQAQFLMFGILALLSTAIFWRFFRVAKADNETSKLNNRMAQLVGVRASLLIEVKGGRGKVQIQDALWTVSCAEDLKVGTLVEVVGYDDNFLHVIKVA